jgi:hypothetical protein
MFLFESRSMSSASELLLRGITIVTEAEVAASRALPPTAMSDMRSMQHVRFSEVVLFKSKRERTSCQDNIKDVKKKYPLFMVKPMESETAGSCSVVAGMYGDCSTHGLVLKQGCVLYP